MFSRISSFALLAALAGCGSGTETETGAGTGTAEEQTADAPASNRVACATGPGEFADDCTMERNGNSIMVRHADGGFRRFEVDAAGRFGTADGADEVSGERHADGSVDVSIGNRRYRFLRDQLKL